MSDSTSNITTQLTQSAQSNIASIIMEVADTVTMPAAHYKKLTKDYNDLTTQNESLRKQLNLQAETIANRAEFTMKYDKLMAENERLTKENSELKQQVEQHKIKIKELEDKIVNHENKITELAKYKDEQIEIEKNNKDMMVSAEICSAYEKAVIKGVFGYNSNIRLSELLYNERQLTADQQERWNSHKQNIDIIGIKKIDDYIYDLKKDRNYTAHALYKSPDMTAIDAKQHIYAFIESFKDKKTEDKYKKVAILLINTLQSLNGDCIFANGRRVQE
ncbi:MAG: hypothetical protein Faunusvirus2_6 [Faunusvirus sp.]|jgi:chromosome segregation ATPase|uniref:Uncharacterized protein n=1 Tax=Faunusvirus sp. TaxID=2487766 RepID=A0A3G5A0G3_9VIRU|nr:MAG: hypothetical protein Faunusvirus2_6 [Faunusvirus sp.]